jgi:hypothetical protein
MPRTCGCPATLTGPASCTSTARYRLGQPANGGAIDGLGLATFLLGDTSSFGRYVSSSTNAQERQKRFFWYGQDEWRVTPKLTATLGVRWEMVFPESVNAPGTARRWTLQNGLMYVFGEGGVSIARHSNHELARIRAESRLGLSGRQKDGSPGGLRLVVQSGNVWLHVWPQCDPESAGVGLTSRLTFRLRNRSLPCSASPMGRRLGPPISVGPTELSRSPTASARNSGLTL